MYSIFANIIVFVMLGIIIICLGYGLFYLLSNKQNGNRTYKALALRICLSMLLFLGLILALYFKWVTPGPPPL